MKYSRRIKATKRFDKACAIQSLAKFYHDEELAAAKLELCKCLQAMASATPTAPGIDGLSKFVNSNTKYSMCDLI